MELSSYFVNNFSDTIFYILNKPILMGIKVNVLFKVLLSFLLIFVLLFSFTFLLYRVLFPIQEHLLLMATFSTDISLVIVVFLLLRLWKIPTTEFLGSITLKNLLWIFAVTIVLKFLMPLFNINSFFSYLFVGKIKILEFKQNKFLFGINDYTQLYFNAKSLLIAPFFEEVLFRGIFIKKITEKYSAIIAILFSSFLFGLYHMDFEQSIVTFFIGIVLGTIYFKTKNLSLVIAIHFLNNLFTLFLTDKVVTLDGWYILLFAIYPILFFLLYVIIKRLTFVNLKKHL